ncbi:ATP phosphoribosyltransferase [candidate division KSB1 bacterium]|nr:ATP phosphoribosyltransferase [candidate division KSB1 bacterium]
MQTLKMVIPKGRIYTRVVNLLNDAGFGIEADDRVYVPTVEDKEIEAKIMKPQNIPKLLELGSHDIGFTGHDWVVETGADVVEVMDLGFDRVKIVAAVPIDFVDTNMKSRKIVVASEYETIASAYLDKQGYDYILLRTFGATEVFPPDDADMIIDNTSTGRTLKENNLHIVDTVMKSSTCFVANKEAMNDPWKREKIDEIKMLLQSVLDARSRVMLEMNIPKDRLDDVVKQVPAMRSPTVAPLYGDQGFAVKIAVARNEVVKLVPLLKKLGATDILEYEIRKVVL